jgi:uncharacterized protein
MRIPTQILGIFLLLLGGWIGFDLVSHLIVESLWFQELGYLPVFLLRLQTQGILWTIATCFSAFFCLGNIWLTHRFKYPSRSRKAQEYSPLEIPLFSPQFSEAPQSLNSSESSLKLLGFFGLALSLSLLVGLMIIHYGQICLNYWDINAKLPTVLLQQPLNFELNSIRQLLREFYQQKWLLGFWLILSIPLLIKPDFCLSAIALIFSLVLGFIASYQWANILPYFNQTSFNITEPLFHKEISFYIFSLPIADLITFGLSGLCLYTLIACTLIYLLSGDSLIKGKFPGFSRQQKQHLYGLSGLLMCAIALRYWLLRYHLVYSPEGVTYGASYTDVTTRLPAYIILSVISGAIGIFFLWQTRYKIPIKNINIKILLAFFSINFWLTFGIPTITQKLIVEPNELAREIPYIKRSISFTRKAFDLTRIDVKTFDPLENLTINDLEKNHLTIKNIRLWDKDPILKTNRQLQQIRSYYSFPDADIERYSLKESNNPKTEKQQVFLAARELDYSGVPQQAQTWVNQNLVYTHGYGFTMSPVNTVVAGGLPDYFVKDIGVNKGDEPSSLGIKNEAIKASLPISHPRIYYGEITNNQIMVPSNVKEFDYPQGDQNVYNTYEGKGGISLNNLGKKLIFSQYLKNWEILFVRNFIPTTKLLFRRNINQIIRQIAPFLRYDQDPYLVVADITKYTKESGENYLYWMIDAYTTSDRYPYSDPGNNPFNYIRNSVKVVIDAYNGSVNFYIANPEDPLIQTWQKIFPSLFHNLEEMPESLREHIRYPVDLFSIQSERLLTYHIEDTQVFYNREDLWRVPNEIYGNKQQAVKPYYLIMKLPTEKDEEFILLLPFTPASRNNLIAWLAGRSDGKNYGKLLLYQFPKQRLIYGPEQIEALINQDPIISEQISLWNRQGSKAIQGNLLVIPIEQSLLYVEPLYLEASENGLPTLVRVIVTYQNRIVMAETLEQALQELFQSQKPKPTTIIRPVE